MLGLFTGGPTLRSRDTEGQTGRARAQSTVTAAPGATPAAVVSSARGAARPTRYHPLPRAQGEEGCSMRTADRNATDAARGAQGASPWQDALNQLREWDPEWAETIVKMTTNPWTTGVLPRKTVELVSVALNAGSGRRHPE